MDWSGHDNCGTYGRRHYQSYEYHGRLLHITCGYDILKYLTRALRSECDENLGRTTWQTATGVKKS